MGGDVETIKERLDIAEVVGNYVKLEKAGQSFKARCPFHNEKTPSFFVSPSRQSYYCFGCGAKGDIFTFVEEFEGLDFREALKMLAERAGVELKYRPEASRERDEKERMYRALEDAVLFFENQLKKNEPARKYLLSRGLNAESFKNWRIGYALPEWRTLYHHLSALGYSKEVLIKAGLIKPVTEANKEPYDVFRDRLIFPIADSSGEVIAFSGRALKKSGFQEEAGLPKYLNSPDTILFTKSEILYGLDKAKEKIRKKNYAVLVEGQIDLVLSHQAGVDNTVASSGTAFTRAHLERLKKLSPRIILAFDGDKAGQMAAEKATVLALSLGLEVKIAKLPIGKDPADMVKSSSEAWKEILRQALPAVEHFLDRALEEEKDRRKLGKLIEKKVLPMIALLQSSIERSHFVSLMTSRTGIKEEVIWDDLRKTSTNLSLGKGEGLEHAQVRPEGMEKPERSHKELIEERLWEVKLWIKELPEASPEKKELKKEKKELEDNLSQELLHEELAGLKVALSGAETSKDEKRARKLTKRIQEVLKNISILEQKKAL
ncbi:MAG: DNA primase [Candidatus Zambryskibacteria bacterium]|nr:DNA primase [Candidatus Zambryskibacteria bacterium]